MGSVRPFQSSHELTEQLSFIFSKHCVNSLEPSHFASWHYFKRSADNHDTLSESYCTRSSAGCHDLIMGRHSEANLWCAWFRLNQLGYLANKSQIMEQCLVNQKENDTCKLNNLTCVCKASRSIVKSTYFDQNCLFNECYNENGRRGK